jgi:hypothetical protein
MSTDVLDVVKRGGGDQLRIVRRELGLLFGVVGLFFWIDAVKNSHFLNMNVYGLVSILGWPYFVGIILVVVGFTIEVFRTPLRSGRLILLVALLVLFIFGTACAVEPVSSLTSSWVHAGFIQYIIEHGRVLNGYDARFSWPGGFTMAAVLVSFVGQTDAIGFLRWFPFFIELAYLAPLLVIARFSGVSRRAGWLGIALCYASNWIYQDYFSPQALNYLFFLVIIAAVFACWQPKPIERRDPNRRSWKERVTQSRRLLTSSRLEGLDTTTTWANDTTIGVLVLIAVIMLASSMSHQLTPYMIILALSVCLLSRRLGRPELVVLIAVFAVGWLSLGASNYWVGHLNDIFGGFGQVSSTIGSNVTGRLAGGLSHVIIVETRILLTLGLFFFAGIGFLRRSTDSRILEGLAGAPFLVLLAQSYGGEGLQRVVLFGLPFTSLMAASAIFPLRTGAIPALLPTFSLGRFSRFVGPTLRVVVFLFVLGFALATTIVRGGNDSYESFSKGELAAVNYAYNHVKAGQVVGSVNGYLPIGFRGIGSVKWLSANENPSTPAHSLGNQLLRARPIEIVLSKSQQLYGEEASGYPPNWEVILESRLVNHGYRIVEQSASATVLRLKN